MIEKLKICLVGATAVGKTSLVGRFVRSVFSEHYRTTIGVAIERRDLRRAGRIVQLVLWDLSGEDEFQSVQPAYLRGAAGYVLVMDVTRPETIETAITLQARVRAAIGDVPFVVAINKWDLAVTAEPVTRELDWLERQSFTVVRTSAKTGGGVEAVFDKLVDAIHAREAPWIATP